MKRSQSEKMGAGEGARKVWTRYLGLACVLVVAATLRIQHLRADPPVLLPSISGSAGIYFDEGIYCHNARNKILFGRWITDEWNPVVYNAPLTLVYFLAFRVFGISMVTVKVLAIFMGLAGIMFFALGTQVYLSPGRSLGLAALFGLDFCGLMYNRIGLLENFTSLCFLASFFLFVRARGRSGWLFFLGVTTAMAALSKYLFAYFLISVALAVACDARRRSDLRALLSFLGGVLAVAMPWFFGIFLPFRPMFGKIGGGWGMLSLPRSAGQAWSNLIRNPLPRYLQLVPVAALFLILFGGLILLKLVRPKRLRFEPVDIFVFFWIIGGVLSLGLLNYRPLRYYVPILPALFLAGSLLIKDRDAVRMEAQHFWPLTILPAGLLFPVFRMMISRPSAFFTFPPVLRAIIFLALAGAVLALALRPVYWRRFLEIGLLGLLLAGSLFLYFKHFYSQPTYNLERASRFMETLPPDSIVMGQEAPRLTLGTRLKSILAYENWFNDRDTFARFQPTHIIVLDRFGDAEAGWIRRRYPEKASLFEVVRKFNVWDTTMTLYRVPSHMP
jgi:4-amino-4-deoxy-L-arabinose transferase-like glycosyltransferase